MRILVITGAGISAESGIPTFRGPDGYWRNFDPTKLATPEAFARDPRLVWEWYRERRQRIRNAQPNAAHQAIVWLATKTSQFLLVTQNVDDLHLRAEWEGERLPKEKIVQIHGNIFVTRCSRCDFQYDGDESGDLPKCSACGALMRPGVVWFGEQLRAEEITRVDDFLDDGPSDTVLVVGTTALFSYIVDWSVRAAGKTGRLIEINPEETSLSQFASHVIREPAAIVLPGIIEQLITGRSCV